MDKELTFRPARAEDLPDIIKMLSDDTPAQQEKTPDPFFLINI